MSSIFTFKVLITLCATLLANGLALPTGALVNDALAARDSGAKFVSFDFNVVRPTVNSTAPVAAGDATNASSSSTATPISAPISNKQVQYDIDLEVGSNKQKITVQVDTGSSDLWFVDTNGVCSSGHSQCKSLGTYDPSQSTTSHKTSELFDLTYIDKSHTSGYYYLDDITLPGGQVVPQFQFADATSASTNNGILGIGLDSGEAGQLGGPDPNPIYPDFPEALKNAGLIDKAAYSLYLNSASATSGTLLFGGIDTAKYSGDIHYGTTPWTFRLGIQVDSITIGGTVQSLNTSFVFDSGYSYSRWPSNIVTDINNALSGTRNLFGTTYANCDQPDENFTITFGSTTVEVPLSSFIAPGGGFFGLCQTTPTNADPSDINNLPTFGDDVLRSAYVVYNLDENTVGVAQAVYTTDSNIVPI